jgi:hypothetical protein
VGPSWLFCPSHEASGVSFVPKKSSKSFAAFGLHLIWIFWKTKNKQKTATGTGHEVNMLVHENHIKVI